MWQGYTQPSGEVAEWPMAAVLKTADPHGSGGSNPSLSASLLRPPGFGGRLSVPEPPAMPYHTAPVPVPALEDAARPLRKSRGSDVQAPYGPS